MKHRVVALGLALLCTVLFAGRSYAATDEAQRAARWKDLQTEVFGARPVHPTDNLIVLDAPGRAIDAAFVPVTLTMPQKDKVAGVYLFIDDNPSPYAAHFTFGPAADPAEIKLQVRVDSYTDMHAVLETKDGQLYETSRFIKAAGGCSAPASVSDEEALQGMGQMRLKLADARGEGAPAQASLMIRHPNFNGMQQDAVGGYTPARFIREVDVTSGGEAVFKMQADISLSSNPVIGFRFAPQGPVDVVAVDSQNGRWEQHFDIASATP